MRITGTIDGAPFRSSLMPGGEGAVFVVVPSALRDRIRKTSGQTVSLALAVDPRPVVIRVPADFRRALGTHRVRFDRLAPSHRKAFVQWIDSAKRPETRSRRLVEAVRMVRRGETLH
jgi:hypothetical protein